jgi:hypothetical protein
MTLLTPSILDTKAYDFSVLRHLWEGALIQSGAVAAGDLLVSPKASQPPMGVSVAAGAAWVRATTGTRNGAYHVVNDGPVELTLEAANGSNPRVDRVVLTVNDSADLGSPTDTPSLAVITGTPTAGATLVNLNGAAAQPANSLTLAHVLVAAAATSVSAANVGNLADPYGTAQGTAAATGAITTAPPAYALGRPSNLVPNASLFHNTTQSLTSGSATALNMNSERYDTQDGHSTSSNTSRYTIATPGTYLLGAAVEFAANATGDRRLALRLNGSTLVAEAATRATAAGTTRLTTSRAYRLVPGDYVEAVATQDSGGALNTGSATTGAAQELSATWIAP